MWARYISENSAEIIQRHNYSDEELQENNILKYREVTVDSTYYRILGSYTYEVDGEYVVATPNHLPKSVEDVKEYFIKEIKKTASEKLLETDWVVIRKADENIDIPQDLQTYRAEVRQVSNQKEAQVNQLSTLNELIEFQNQPWVETHLVMHFAGDDLPLEYGPDTIEKNVTLSGVYDLWPEDPTKDQSLTFVSRVEAVND